MCYVAVMIPKGEGAIFGRKRARHTDKPNTANNCDFGYEGPISRKCTYVKEEGRDFTI